eukprot:COSAG01_NODE_3598_length_5891_cov_36.754662_1_plen_129_part_00
MPVRRRAARTWESACAATAVSSGEFAPLAVIAALRHVTRAARHSLCVSECRRSRFIVRSRSRGSAAIVNLESSGAPIACLPNQCRHHRHRVVLGLVGTQRSIAVLAAATTTASSSAGRVIGPGLRQLR